MVTVTPEQTEACCSQDTFLPVKGTEGCGDLPLTLQAAQLGTATVCTHAGPSGASSTVSHRRSEHPSPGRRVHPAQRGCSTDGKKLRSQHSAGTRTHSEHEAF